MDEHTQEIARLQEEVAKLYQHIARREGDIARLMRRINTLEAEINRLKEARDFFIEQNNLNLAENRYLRDVLNKNPYSDDFYNEQ